MTTLLLKTLLAEYASQLRAGIAAAQQDLQVHQTPTRKRQWKDGGLSLEHLFPPREDSPPDTWHWVEVYPPNPALSQIQQVLEKLEALVDSLPA